MYNKTYRISSFVYLAFSALNFILTFVLTKKNIVLITNNYSDMPSIYFKMFLKIEAYLNPTKYIMGALTLRPRYFKFLLTVLSSLDSWRIWKYIKKIQKKSKKSFPGSTPSETQNKAIIFFILFLTPPNKNIVRKKNSKDIFFDKKNIFLWSISKHLKHLSFYKWIFLFFNIFIFIPFPPAARNKTNIYIISPIYWPNGIYFVKKSSYWRPWSGCGEITGFVMKYWLYSMARFSPSINHLRLTITK